MIWLIACGVPLAILIIAGLAQELTGEISVVSVTFTTVVLIVTLGLFGGVLYGLSQL